MPAETPPVWKQEEQLLEALRQVAPPDAWLLVVGSQPGSAGKPACAGVYLTHSAAGEWAASALPALPAALQKRFVALLAAMRAENGGVAWDACRVTLPLNLLEAYQYDVRQQLEYGCRTAREGSVDAAAGAAYELPAPAALLAQVRGQADERVRQQRLNPDAMRQILLKTLLPALPDRPIYFFILRQEPAADGTTASLRGFYVGYDGSEWQVQPVPALAALPPAVATDFADLRRAVALYTGYPWDSVELVVRHVPDDNDEYALDAEWYYNQPRPLRGLLDDAHLPPAEFITRMATALAEPPDVEGDAAAEYEAPAPARAADTKPAPAAATTWVCTWCKQIYTSAKQPTSFQPDKCPRNPGKAHAWHKK